MRFEFPFNFIRKLIIKARTQILVYGGEGGGGGWQDKDFGAVSQTNLTRGLTSSVPQAYIKGNNQESCSGFPQTLPTHCYGFVACIIMIGHFLNHG